MPISSGSTFNSSSRGNPTIMRKNLLLVDNLFNKAARPLKYKKIAGRILTTQQAYEDFVTISGFGMPSVVLEYGTLPEDTITQPFTGRIVSQKRGLIMVVSDEAFKDDQYGILKNYSTQFRNAFEDAKETAAAVFLNGCTTTALMALANGQPLSSASQPLDSSVGTTDSNTFTVQQTLGIQPLEQAWEFLNTQKTHKGVPFVADQSFLLEVHPRNFMLAQRLIEATGLPQGNSNDPNPMGKVVAEIVANQFYTNPEWWSLRSMNDNFHKRFYCSREEFRWSNNHTPTYYMENDSWKISGLERYVFGCTDYRGTFYSTPS
jgi:hypothetical protein